MKRSPLVLICSGDPVLGRRLAAILYGLADARREPDADGAERLLERLPVEALIADLRQPDALPLVDALRRRRPSLPIIALGPARSDPRRTVEALGVFAVEEPGAEPQRLHHLVALAIEQRRLTEELEDAQVRGCTSHDKNPAPPAPAQDSSWNETGLPLARALRSVDRPDTVWENVLDWISASTRASRVGIFAATPSGVFRLRAGLRHLEETASLEFDRADPLVRWFEMRLHIAARITLGLQGNAQERRILQQALDAMGAEILAPLHVRDRLLGWVFIGSRASGIPFEPADLERMVILVDQVSRVIENTLLYEEAVLQKTTAETLLKAIPTGIISVDRDGFVLGLNTAAERILGLQASELAGQPAESLGSRIGSLLRQVLEDVETEDQAWSHPEGRSLVLSARPLEHEGNCLGAMVLVTDMTSCEELAQREQQLERAQFWTDLAAGMSHEIRNPLVAIKTFAQLLPERYMDEDFRAECSSLLASEADRLNAIVEQISNYASPPTPSFHPVGIEPLLRRALARCENDTSLPPLRCQVEIEEPLPPLLCDAEALAEALTHLLRNAAEALAGRTDGLAVIRARHVGNRPRPLTEISVQDNGPGIPPDIRERAFSPFTTTKARGMGLGLAIVHRTALDHGGAVHLDSSGHGTRVTMVFPST